MNDTGIGFLVCLILTYIVCGGIAYLLNLIDERNAKRKGK